MNDFNEDKLLKKLKVYRGILVILITLLFAAVGYSYTLRLDLDYLQNKVKEIQNELDIVKNSYFRNLQQSFWDHLESGK